MIRKNFPLLKKKVNGKYIIYFNSAATSQKPKEVIDSIKYFYENFNSNVHRGSDEISIKAENIYEESRKRVADFINASPSEIVYTKNCTESINIVANGFPLNQGDKIVISILEHHSNFVPWMELRKRGVKIEVLDIDNEGKIILDENKIKNAKIIAISHLSNVLGNLQDIKEICKVAHKNDCLVLVDAAQGVGHIKINVKDLGCDFLVFSGHKMFSINGIGILYGKKELLEKINPLIYGGDMIKNVSLNNISYAEVPRKFEGGTQNYAAIYSLSKAIDFIEKENIHKIEEKIKELTNYALKKIKQIREIEIYGKDQIGVISFNVNDVHSHDVAEFLSSKNIYVRSGHMCCQPLMEKLEINSVVRISFHIYNEKKDINILCKELKNCINLFNNGHV